MEWVIGAILVVFGVVLLLSGISGHAQDLISAISGSSSSSSSSATTGSSSGSSSP